MSQGFVLNDLSLSPNLHYSPIVKTFTMRASQKTDCFLARSLYQSRSKAFEDFPKSS